MSTLIRLALAAAALALVLVGPQAIGQSKPQTTEVVAFCPGPRGCHS